jgi:hypothetical protein
MSACGRTIGGDNSARRGASTYLYTIFFHSILTVISSIAQHSAVRSTYYFTTSRATARTCELSCVTLMWLYCGYILELLHRAVPYVLERCSEWRWHCITIFSMIIFTITGCNHISLRGWWWQHSIFWLYLYALWSRGLMWLEAADGAELPMVCGVRGDGPAILLLWRAIILLFLLFISGVFLFRGLTILLHNGSLRFHEMVTTVRCGSKRSIITLACVSVQCSNTYTEIWVVVTGLYTYCGFRKTVLGSYVWFNGLVHCNNDARVCSFVFVRLFVCTYVHLRSCVHRYFSIFTILRIFTMFTCALYIARGRNILPRANVCLHFVVFLGDIFVAVILCERNYRSQAIGLLCYNYLEHYSSIRY